jgi:hypothetical protein
MVAGIAILVAVALVAIAAKRPKAAAQLGGAILVAIGVGAVFIPLWTFLRRDHLAPAEYGPGAVVVAAPGGEWQFDGGGHGPLLNGGVSWFAILLVLAVPIALFVIAALWLTLRKSAGRGGSGVGWLPALILIPLVAFFFVGTRRHQESVNQHARAALQEAHVAQQTAFRQAEMARHAAQLNAHVQHQIASMNIHQLMDRVDAPRIELSAEAPPPPSPPDAAPAPDSPRGTTAPAEPADHDAARPDLNDSREDGTSETAIAETDTDDSRDHAADRESSGESEQIDAEAEDVAEAEKNVRSDDPAAPQADEKLMVELETPENQPPAQRPQWLDDPPKRVGDWHRDVLVTDEYVTVAECYRAADIQLQLATYDHLARLVGIRNDAEGDYNQSGNGVVRDSRLDALKAMGIGIDYIRREIAPEEYIETVERSFGPMKKVSTLVEFTPAVDRELRNHWNALQRRERFGIVGLGAGSVLGVIGLAYGLLKVDTLTKGYYSKRLFLGVPGAIIGGGLLLMALDAWMG